MKGAYTFIFRPEMNKPKKMGDAVASVAQPIARLVDRVAGTDLEHCAGCKQMQEDLNAGMGLLPAVVKRLTGQD